MRHDQDSDEQEAEARSYRVPMRVTAVRSYPECPQLFTYPICPRCGKTMDREYQSYCDRCGQALDWKGFSKAVVISNKKMPPTQKR